MTVRRHKDRTTPLCLPHNTACRKLIYPDHPDHANLLVRLKQIQNILYKIMIDNKYILMQIYLISGIGCLHPLIVSCCHRHRILHREDLNLIPLRNPQMMDIIQTFLRIERVAAAYDKAYLSVIQPVHTLSFPSAIFL